MESIFGLQIELRKKCTLLVNGDQRTFISETMSNNIIGQASGSLSYVRPSDTLVTHLLVKLLRCGTFCSAQVVGD